jgi:hypothetical protein
LFEDTADRQHTYRRDSVVSSADRAMEAKHHHQTASTAKAYRASMTSSVEVFAFCFRLFVIVQTRFDRRLD